MLQVRVVGLYNDNLRAEPGESVCTIHKTDTAAQWMSLATRDSTFVIDEVRF